MKHSTVHTQQAYYVTTGCGLSKVATKIIYICMVFGVSLYIPWTVSEDYGYTTWGQKLFVLIPNNSCFCQEVNSYYTFFENQWLSSCLDGQRFFVGHLSFLFSLRRFISCLWFLFFFLSSGQSVLCCAKGDVTMFTVLSVNSLTGVRSSLVVVATCSVVYV